MSGLSPQFIMRASLARYIKEIASPSSDAEPRWKQPEQQRRSGESEIENLTWYSDYAEPGYHLSHGDKGILSADWNYFHRNISDLLEQAGFEIEWRDEWTACDECQKAIRTSGDCYDWQPFYVNIGDCSTVCLNCVDWQEYLESIEDNANMACMCRCDPAKYGYERISDANEYETGWHPGQNDSPHKILAGLQDKGYEHIVFRISETSQFYSRWEVWQKVLESEDETAELTADATK